MALAAYTQDAQIATPLELLGITTVGVNASLARTTRNALANLEHTDQCDVPVSKGGSQSLKDPTKVLG